MVFSLNIEEYENLFDEFYQKKTQELLGFPLSNLTLKKQNVTTNDCSKCQKHFRVNDSGLYEDNVALFWYVCVSEAPTSNYCAGIISEKERYGKERYRFCYDKTSINSIENAIKICDYIRACDVSYKTMEICKHRIRQKKMVDEPFIRRLIEGNIKSNLHSRKRMWYQINEGLRRLLVMPKKASKNEANIVTSIDNINGLNVRTFHGNQLSDLMKRDRYNVLPIKEDVLMFGHYHLQMVLYKFDTWILITGHWTSYKNPRRLGFLSHIGGAIMQVDNEDEPFFVLNRFPDVKTKTCEKY